MLQQCLLVCRSACCGMGSQRGCHEGASTALCSAALLLWRHSWPEVSRRSAPDMLAFLACCMLCSDRPAARLSLSRSPLPFPLASFQLHVPPLTLSLYNYTPALRAAHAIDTVEALPPPLQKQLAVESGLVHGAASNRQCESCGWIVDAVIGVCLESLLAGRKQ